MLGSVCGRQVEVEGKSVELGTCGMEWEEKGDLFDVLKVHTDYIMPLHVDIKTHYQSQYGVHDGNNFNLSVDGIFHLTVWQCHIDGQFCWLK